MKVIVTVEYEMETWRTVTVRKCPPNYKVPFSNYLGECEFICELEDYTEEDIKNYFEIETMWETKMPVK